MSQRFTKINIKGEILPDTESSLYWSSTIRPGEEYHRLGVYFKDHGGRSGDDKSYAYYVRAVRGGKS